MPPKRKSRKRKRTTKKKRKPVKRKSTRKRKSVKRKPRKKYTRTKQKRAPRRRRTKTKVEIVRIYERVKDPYTPPRPPGGLAALMGIISPKKPKAPPAIGTESKKPPTHTQDALTREFKSKRPLLKASGKVDTNPAIAAVDTAGDYHFFYF